ncbi:MAG: glycoside hydrolase family 25 protein [Lachnospiraceae bacterium]|nr:glycoside hydrolase family 25 protein [Lachnospiraceae bacterium]
MSKRRRGTQGLAANIIFSLIALFALSISIVLLLMNYNMKNRLEETVRENETLAEYAKAHTRTDAEVENAADEAAKTADAQARAEILDNIRRHMQDGNTAYSLLRTLYPNEIVVPSDTGYVFFEISDELKHHEYDLDRFYQNAATKEVTYQDESGNTISQKGIDVSRYNGKIDWEKVKGDGVEFAFIRAGYRGSSEGKLVTDDNFTANIEGALEAGVKVGVYFFTQAISAEEGREEAEYVLDLIRDYDVTMPVVLDVETYANGRGEAIDASTRTDAALAFLDTVRDAGYTPMLYANLKGYLIMLETDRIEGYDKWFAYYASFPVYYPYDFQIWQYSEKGEVAGIDGDCDLNVCMKRY